MSEVVRVIMEEIPTESNCWREMSWLFCRSIERISNPKREARSLAAQLPHAATPVDRMVTASIHPPIRRTAFMSP